MHQSPTSDTPRDLTSDRGEGEIAYLRRLLIAVAVIAVAALLWSLSRVLVLVFGAVLVAVSLRAAADLVAERTPVPRRWSLPVAGAAILLVLALSLLLVANGVGGQFGELSRRLPAALDDLAKGFGFGEGLAGLAKGAGGGAGLTGDLFTRVASVGFLLAGGVADLLLVVFAGIFLALDPGLYARGLVDLFPPAQHERVRGTLAACGRALRLWLAGKLLAMGLVAALTASLMWLIGVPSPLALGLVAGLSEFVAFVGPLIAGVAILLAALSEGPTTVALAFAAVLAIQQIESNMITPMVQQRAVDLPPALTLFSVLAFAVLFGTLGVLFSEPLTVVAFVAVKKLYVRETLGEATEVPGEA